MSYICEKPKGSCQKCEHYRFDDDYNGMACFAEHDAKYGMPKTKEQQNREELFKLMQEHPELPVVPMVDGEIVADDGYARWLGSWGTSYIGEYLVGEEQVHFREEDDPYEIERVLTDGAMDYDAYEKLSEAEAAAEYSALPWIEAIIVNIDLPS